MSDEAMWWITLGAGLVVAGLLVVLLQIFLNHVLRIERAAQQVWRAGKHLAGNTSTTWMLEKTPEQVDAIAAGLSEPGGKPRRARK